MMQCRGSCALRGVCLSTDATATARAFPSILYKILYTDLYIYPHSYIFNFFLISHRLFFVCKARGQCRCSVRVCVTIWTERSGFYLRVFRKGKAFIPCLSTVSFCSCAQCFGCQSAKYFVSIYDFHFSVGWYVIYEFVLQLLWKFCLKIEYGHILFGFNIIKSFNNPNAITSS